MVALMPAFPYRLLATDLDGTLLRPDLSVSARSRAALDAARARGVLTVPVTARQPHGVLLIAQQAGFEGWALCSNGALGVHLSTGEVLFEAALPASTQLALARALLQRLPDTVFLSVRDAGRTFVAQPGYAALAQYSDHKRHPQEMPQATLDEVLSVPSLKLAARHPRLGPAELLREVLALDAAEVGSFAATLSGAPFVELMAAGVNKAWGLARLCRHLQIPAGQVLAETPSTTLRCSPGRVTASQCLTLPLSCEPPRRKSRAATPKMGWPPFWSACCARVKG